MRPTVLAVMLVLLQACGGMDLAECRTADWRAIGYEDGVQGRAIGTLGKRRTDCAEHGVTPNFDAYVAGRNDGLSRFCRPQNGYRMGKRGKRYSGVCPGALERPFVAAHGDGLGVHQRDARVRHLRNRLHRGKRRINEIERLLVEKTALLISPTLTPQRRASVAVDLKHLAEEKGEIQQSIPQLVVDLADAEQDYGAYLDFISARYGE